MTDDRQPDSSPEADPSSVEKPSGPAPDAGRAYDPAMTDEDEANIPPDSDVDPNAAPQAG